MSWKFIHAVSQRSLWLALIVGTMFGAGQLIPPQIATKAVSLMASAVWGS